MKISLGESRASTWTERRKLLPASLGYLFSVDATLTSLANTSASFGILGGGSMGGGPPGSTADIGRLDNVFAASSVDVAGTARVPPSGTVVAASCTMDPEAYYGSVKLRGDFTIRLDGKDELLRMSYTGPISSPNPSQLSSGQALPGFGPGRTTAVFVSAVQECAVPELRWLTRTQLFGVGRVVPVADSVRSSYRFEYDFYFDGRRLQPADGVSNGAWR